MRAARALALLAALALAGCGRAPVSPHAGGAPKRVVSINPCVDAVLMRVADRRQIAAISHYSQDPRASSIPLDVARHFRATSGTAEEVIALSPDLVIAGSHVSPATTAALARLGIPVLQIGVSDSISDSVAQVRQIAAAVGHADRGARLAGAIETAVAARHAGPPLPALIWQGGGLVPGAGTLPDDVLRAAGFRNMSADYGLQRWDVLPLEPLVARPPRVLLSVGESDQDDRMLRHPVLRALGGRVAMRAYPEHLLQCGGPTIIEAARRLAAIRRSL